MTPAPAPPMPPPALCEMCAAPYAPSTLPWWEDFGIAPGYCSAQCESAHGDLILRSLQREEALEKRAYRRTHMWDPNWRAHLTPVGDADRCRNCTGVFFASAQSAEFCSDECEADFRHVQSQYDDTRDRNSDTATPAA